MRYVASFDVDAQKGFTPICPNELPVPGGDEIVDELNYLAGLVDLRVGSKDAHPPGALWTTKAPFEVIGEKNVDIAWPEHCVVGTEGFELLDGLPRPEKYNFFVYKGLERDMHPYGACYHDVANHQSTGVIEYLEGEGVGLVIVSGLAYDYCVKTTALQLANVFRVIVWEPGTRAVALETAVAAREELDLAGVLVMNDRQKLREYLQEW